ncbi:hypothetical protein MASR1M45_30250 [Candidatus Kapaibacterium sp.]
MAKKSNEKPTDNEKKYQKKVAQEKKKLERIISTPPKAVLMLSLIVGLLTFTFTFFGNLKDPISAILQSFIAFSIAFIGIGFSVSLYFYYKSEALKKEYHQMVLNEKQDREQAEQQRIRNEISELEAIERELADKRSKSSVNRSGNDEQAPRYSRNTLSDEEAYLDEVLNSNFTP